MAFQFSREQILPLFLQRRMNITELARQAGINPRTAERAVRGLPVSASVIDKVANALDFDATKFLAEPTAQV